MAVFTIAGLTLKEAVRRRTLIGAVLLGLFVLGLSLLLILIRRSMLESVAEGRSDMTHFAMEYAVARGAITLLCLSAIKILGALFALMIAGGAISGEIERGLLAVILSRPIPRWQILLGKWLGMNLLLSVSVLSWTLLVWGSLTWQTRQSYTALLPGGLYLTLIPVLVCTLTLTLSTVAQRVLGISLAIALCGFAWLDGLFDALGIYFKVDFLRRLASFAGLVVPQGYVSWWVENATRDLIYDNPFGERFFSPRWLNEWGSVTFQFAHLDAVYIAAYLVAFFLLGAFLFHRRDI